MSQAIIFKEAVELVKTIDGIKTVDGWRGQFDNYTKEDGFLMPAVFIRIEPSNFRDIGGASGIQLYDCLLTLLIGFDVYKGTEYQKALELKEKVFKKFHRFEPMGEDERGKKNIGRFLRNGEEMQDLEYNNVLIWGQSYLCQNCWDYSAQTQYKTVTVNMPITRTQTSIVTQITN